MKFKKYKNAVFGHFNRQKQNIGEIIEFELFYRFLAMILAQPVVSFLFHNIKKVFSPLGILKISYKLIVLLIVVIVNIQMSFGNYNV